MRLNSEWTTGEKFDRTFYLEDDDGDVLEEFQGSPTLDAIRQAEKKQNSRILLTDLGIPCSICDSEIRGRFGATPRGDLLCWDCAVTSDTQEDAGVRVNTDPTSATISESSLFEKSLCDHVINVATGCRHGCKFCYVPTTPGYEGREDMLEEHAGVENLQKEWGSYLLYRDDLPERLHQELEQHGKDSLNRTERGRGVVMLSSGTDPYQDRRAAQISRATIQELVSYEIPVRVLTRSTIVVQDVGLFQDAGNLVTVGSSIPSFDQTIVKALEPGAPPPLQRWEALDMLRYEGVPVYVSMSPTYPTMGEHDLFRLLTRMKAIQPRVVFHEPINPRGQNFEMMVRVLEEAGLEEEAEEFEQLLNLEMWVEYALKQLNWVQRKAEELNAPPIHSWPDRELMRATSGTLRDQLAAMRQSNSPERFDGQNPAEHDDAHSPLFDSYEEVKDLVDPDQIQ